MNPRIIVQPIAGVDLEEQAEHLARNSPAAAQRFYASVETTFQFLADMPEIGNPCEFRGRRASGLRMWPIRSFENHIVFYRPIESGGILVVRVLHASRDLETIFRG